jgi:hypothetical protein
VLTSFQHTDGLHGQYATFGNDVIAEDHGYDVIIEDHRPTKQV